MESQIKKKYLMDCAIIMFVMIILWAVIIIVMLNISGIAPNRTLRIIIFTIGMLVGIFATASSVAVIIHLKKNQNYLY